MWMDQILATGDRQDQLTNILRLDLQITLERYSYRDLDKNAQTTATIKNRLLTVNKYIVNRIENVATLPETSSHNAL